MELYSINERSSIDQTHVFKVVLDPDHEVYKGHFPGQPVTPGVLQVRIIRELLEQTAEKMLSLKTAQNLKFLRFIDPNEVQELKVSIHILDNSDDELKVKADIADNDGVYFKMMATFGNAEH